MSRPMWSYHSGHQALVFVDPMENKGIGIPPTTVRAAGFKADESDLRSRLPRFDEPRVQVAPASALKAIPGGRRR